MPRDEEEIRKIVEEARDLPSLPTVVAEITEKIRNPSTSASEVAQLIQEDQSLTGNVLRLVNSAFYGFPRQVNSITRAIVILGFNKVGNLALATSVIDAFKGSQGSFDFVAFWKHSLATAVAADVIAKQLDIHEAEDAFTAGLLHDVGKLVIAVCFPAEMADIARAASQPRWIRDCEEKILGIDHARAGYWLSQKWGLPPELSNTLRFHHKPLNARQNAQLVHVVHIADVIARSLDVGNGGDPLVPVIEKEIWDNLGLDEARLDAIFSDTVKGLKKAEAFFEMINEGAVA